jgi:hypothetical protein
MEEALKQFADAEETGADSSSITDNYLEPLNLSFAEPDYAKLEKPAKPPVPEVHYDYCYFIQFSVKNFLKLTTFSVTRDRCYDF